MEFIFTSIWSNWFTPEFIGQFPMEDMLSPGNRKVKVPALNEFETQFKFVFK